MLELDIQHGEARKGLEDVPDDEHLRRAARSALTAAAYAADTVQLSLRIVDREEMRLLNHRFRERDYATNVLSFPADLPADIDVPLLGDVVICASVVIDEARSQGKDPRAHWDHMLVHGVLHLLGFDHGTDAEAQTMEALERHALAALGWPDPYAPITVDACA